MKNFVAVANQNLDALRREYEQLKPHLLQAMRATEQERQMQIAAEDARDKDRSFPVNR